MDWWIGELVDLWNGGLTSHLLYRSGCLDPGWQELYQLGWNLLPWGGPWGVPGECLGGPWGVPGGSLGVPEGPRGVPGRSLGGPWVVPGGPWGVPGGQVGSKMPLMVQLGANFGPACAKLGQSWCQLGAKWVKIDTK